MRTCSRSGSAFRRWCSCRRSCRASTSRRSRSHAPRLRKSVTPSPGGGVTPAIASHTTPPAAASLRRCPPPGPGSSIRWPARADGSSSCGASTAERVSLPRAGERRAASRGRTASIRRHWLRSPPSTSLPATRRSSRPPCTIGSPRQARAGLDGGEFVVIPDDQPRGADVEELRRLLAVHDVRVYASRAMNADVVPLGQGESAFIRHALLAERSKLNDLPSALGVRILRGKDLDAASQAKWRQAVLEPRPSSGAADRLAGEADRAP